MDKRNQRKTSSKLSLQATAKDVEEAGMHYLEQEITSFNWSQAAKDLYALTGAHYVMVCDYNEEENTLITKAVDGIPMKVEAVISFLGFNLIGKKWALFDGVKDELLKPEIKVIE